MANNTSSEKELKRHWPITVGRTAGTTKQEGTQMNMLPTQGSNVPRRKKVGL